MPVVGVRDLLDGMVLQVPAVDSAGRAVLPAGAVIDRAAVGKLQAARIATVNAVDTGRKAGQAGGKPQSDELQPPDTVVVQARLMRLARMFNEHRDDPLMRELCRLAIKCAQERLISV